MADIIVTIKWKVNVNVLVEGKTADVLAKLREHGEAVIIDARAATQKELDKMQDNRSVIEGLLD